MTYEQALSYIHGTLKFGIRPGLSRIRTLLGLMGNPQQGLKFIHVAGTNGKGSTSCAIASALQAAGYRAGLYTSPYIEDFCERMQLDRQNIPREELAAYTARLRPLAEQAARIGEAPTEFELCTALAMGWFAEKKCDVVVLEVGLGGRFDATNIIDTPLVSVVTSISLDHMKILGDTVEKIAYEKSGIIKPGGVTVSAPGQDPSALAVIMEACAQNENTLIIPNENSVRVLEESADGSVIEYKGQRLTVPLAGRHQHRNFITAWETLDALRAWRGLHIPPEAVEKGFASVKFPARFEKLRDRPAVYLDGAHNPGGAATVADTVRRFLTGRRVAVVMGMFVDKDYEATIGLIAPLASSFFAVAPPSPRALPARETARVAERSCKYVLACDTLEQAYRLALADAGDEGVVLVCGSLSLGGVIRPLAAR